MDNVINMLINEFLSKPLFLTLFVCGIAGLLYVLATNYYKIALTIAEIIGAFLVIKFVFKVDLPMVYLVVLVGALVLGGLLALLHIKITNKNKNTTVKSSELNTKDVGSEGICPECGGNLVLRNGKYGQFYGCSNYPKCKYTNKI